MNQISSSGHKPTVLITNADSPLGNSIARNLSEREVRREIRLLGENRFGERSVHTSFCDEVIRSPDTFSPTNFVDLCSRHNIDLVVPTTDWETVILKELERFPPFVLCSPVEVSRIFLDKYETAMAFSRANARFVTTRSPSEVIKGDLFSGEAVVVKPRIGEHSKGVVFSPRSFEAFSDEHFIVQRRLQGPEITTAVYYRNDGSFHGSISLRRAFVESGSLYEVAFEYDQQVLEIATQLSEQFKIVGSINIQSIVHEGVLTPFEVNGRISGSNYVRAAFGFPDVAWSLEEYLFGRKPGNFTITAGCARSCEAVEIFPDRTLKDLGFEAESF